MNPLLDLSIVDCPTLSKSTQIITIAKEEIPRREGIITK
jgi:hypothetical protein